MAATMGTHRNHVFETFSASGTVYLTLDNQLAYRHKFEHHIQVNIVYDHTGIPVTTNQNSHSVSLISDVFTDYSSECCSNFSASTYIQPTLHDEHIKPATGDDYGSSIPQFNFVSQIPGAGSASTIVETVDSIKDSVLELLDCQDTFMTGAQSNDSVMADGGSVDMCEAEVECKPKCVSGQTSDINGDDNNGRESQLEDSKPTSTRCGQKSAINCNDSVRESQLEDSKLTSTRCGQKSAINCNDNVRESQLEDSKMTSTRCGQKSAFNSNDTVRESQLEGSKLTSKRLTWLSLKISRQPTHSFQKNFRNKKHDMKIKKDKTRVKKGGVKIEHSDKEIAIRSLAQQKITSDSISEKVVNKTENKISDKLKIKNRDTINRQRVAKVRKLELEKEVKCEYCLQIFKSQQEYFDHRKGDRKAFECKICGKVIPFKAHLLVHMKKHDNNLQEECLPLKELDKTKAQSSKTPAGSGNYKGGKHIKCEMCGLTVSNIPILKTHMMIHTGEFAYKCCVCGEKTHSIAKQSSHLATHLKSGRVQCKICNIRFETRSDLSRHQLTHEFKCNICDKVFPNKTSRVFHYKMAHKDDILKCEICGKLFSSEEELAPHLKYHRNRAKTQCTICGLFVTRLDNHILSHNQRSEDSKMYVCDQCPKQFKQKLSFQRHLRTHSEEKPYACMECPKRFARSGGLRRHMITHTQEKPFVCSICGKACSQMGNLRIHMQIHKGCSLVQCKFCGENFPYKNNLQEHIETTHFVDMNSQDPSRNTSDVPQLYYL